MKNSPLPRRFFLATSAKTLAIASAAGLSLSSSAQTPSETEPDVIRKNLPVTQTPDLNAFYASRQGVAQMEADREFSFSRGEMTFVLAVDPATIKTIVEIGIFIFSLFGGGNERPTEWIAKVSDQLTKIGKVLEEVQNALEDLKVLIKHEFIQNAEYEVLAHINVYLRNAAKFSANPSATESRNLMNQLKYDIQTRIAKCMLYGFATFNTVGYALRVETDLLHLLKESRAVKKDSFKYYLQYFKDCLNSGIAGSVSNIRVKSEEAVSALETQFPVRNSVREEKGWVNWRSGRCDNTANVFTIINGSLANGFTGSVGTSDHHRECDGCLKCDLARSEFTTFGSQEDALRPYRNELNGRLDVANRASSQYKEALTRIETLKLAEQQVAKFRDVAQELFNRA